MGTRSCIALKRSGRIRALYCHCDGYLDNNGRILLHAYTTPEHVEKLFEMGSLFSLGLEIGQKHEIQPSQMECVTLPNIQGEFMKRCTFYRRDLDQKSNGTEFVDCKDEEEMFERFKWCEYFYMMQENGKWFVCRNVNDQVELTDELIDRLD